MADESYEKSSRCWPGFEPVPGKGEHEQGSCRKKPASKNGGKEVNRETARKKQVGEGGARAKQAKAASPTACERRSVSKTAAKKTAAKKTAAKKTTVKKTAAKKAPAKKTAAHRNSRRKESPREKGGCEKGSGEEAQHRGQVGLTKQVRAHTIVFLLIGCVRSRHSSPKEGSSRGAKATKDLLFSAVQAKADPSLRSG